MLENNLPENKNDKKNKIRNRIKNANSTDIEVIPARPKVNIFDDTNEKNVALYVRVSTDRAEQTSSYELQIKYYTDFIARHPNWKLVKIYADEGISGTSLKNRDAFVQMIKDCKKGGIDLIVTKDTRRWARNIVDGVGSLRQLEELKPPVGVFFESEGLYSLKQEDAMPISILSSTSEQESRAKSIAMNSSIEMRFFNGIYLTPPLLGYDKEEDETGNRKLVINQEEAITVRLIFFLYLYGYSTDKIAEKLTALEKPTKPGNLKWSPGTILSILKSERYCGDVLARKTYTPNFLNHKSVKNNKEKPQYYKRDNHEPIVSRDDFLAVQQMISNAKYKNDNFLPRLRVYSEGALCGFVSVNPRWSSFTADDYRNASISVDIKETRNRAPKINFKINDIDLRKYEIIPVQFFSSANITSVTFSHNGIRFSSDCVRKFGKIVFAELLVYPQKGFFAAHLCNREHKNAVRWAKLNDEKIKPCIIRAKAFISTLYDLFGWEHFLKYRLRGEIIKNVVLFNVNEPELIVQNNHQTNDDMYIIAQSKRFNVSLPLQFRERFGTSYELYKNSSLPDLSLDNTVKEYNSQPGLNPTAPEIIGKNIQKILKEDFNE